MYQSRWCIQLNSKGFTFIEALYHLAVFILITQLLISIYTWLDQINKSLFTNEHVAWELFVYDFQQYLIDVETIKVNPILDEVHLKKTNAEQTLEIKRYGEIIRVRTNQTGHIPLLMDISKAEFDMTGNYLTINVEFKNGIQKERTFFVQTNTE